LLENGVTYLFIQHNNVYVMIASRQNCNAASLLLFLHRVVEVCCVLITVLWHSSSFLRCLFRFRVMIMGYLYNV
jgi:hypothetical protein